jgi:hypothetical protein
MDSINMIYNKKPSKKSRNRAIRTEEKEPARNKQMRNNAEVFSYIVYNVGIQRPKGITARTIEQRKEV